MRAANYARSNVNVLHSGCASCCRESETTLVEIGTPGCIVKLTENVSCLHLLVEIFIRNITLFGSLLFIHYQWLVWIVALIISAPPHPYIIFCLLLYLDFYEIFFTIIALCITLIASYDSEFVFCCVCIAVSGLEFKLSRL